MNKILASMTLGCGLLLAGCATVGARQALAPRVVATFDEHGMTGKRVSLRRDGTSIRGSAYGRPVSIEWDGATVRGSYSRLPVMLTVAPAGEALRVAGEFYGESAAFQYAPQRLEGLLGGCAFFLERGEGNRLNGHRTCYGKKTETLSIAVPGQLAQRSEAERAAWLALFITDGTVEVPFVKAQVIQSTGPMKRPRPGISCGRMGP